MMEPCAEIKYFTMGDRWQWLRCKNR